MMKRPVILLFLILSFIVGGVLFTAKNLKFEESLSSIMPVDEQNKLLVSLLDSASFFDRMIVHVYTPDSLPVDPGSLVQLANQLSDSIQTRFIPEYIESVEGKTPSDIQTRLFNGFAQQLPFYLEEQDYQYIDSLIGSDNLSPLVQEHIKVLNSPAGYMASRYLFADPMGLISKQLHRLEDLQVDDKLMVYRNYLVSKNKRHLTLFLIPSDAGNTGKNKVFIEEFDQLISDLFEQSGKKIAIEYTGSLPIATANAHRIKRDVQITINIAILVIIILILYFYRRWPYLGLVLLPAMAGAVVALIVFTVFKGSISAISLGIASVLLGISVDYALHIFTHLKHTSTIKQVRKDVSLPIFMSSLTTGSAFLGLLALSSPAIRQLGVFAAISVVSSALFAIFILPQLLLKRNITQTHVNRNTLIERLASFQLRKTRWNFILISVITIILGLFIKNVRFEEDFEKLNYMPDHLAAAVENLDNAGDFSAKKSFVLSEGTSLNEAIGNAQKAEQKLNTLLADSVIDKYNSPLSLLLTKEQQQQKIESWNTFWSDDKKMQFNSLLSLAAQQYHIKPSAYSKFTALLDKDFLVIEPELLLKHFSTVAGSFLLTKNKKVYLAQIIQLPDENRVFVANQFSVDETNHLIDKKVFFSQMFENLQTDFDQLLYLSLAIVFIIILGFLGRIELAIVTFTPIVISWLWTLGFIGLSGIKLNFFNIVICSLIFGLGVDYAIFITRGLMQKHKTGTNNLSSYKSSILISGITTLVGLGVLMFAKHPALKSIAGVAVVGILSSVVICFTLQPLLFRFLVGADNKKLRKPITLISFLYTFVTFLAWSLGSLLSSAFIPIVVLLPITKSKKRYIIRYTASKICGFIQWIHPLSKRREINFDKLDFNTPSVIVSNHQSMVDILLYLSLSPNNIILTKDWVWNSPIFGAVVRYSGHINVSLGYDALQDVIQERIAEGCSLVVFPEGSRSKDGKIKRYHKGGFFLAQQHNLPVHKMVIHAYHELLSPDAINLGKCVVTVKYLSTYTFNKPDKNTYSKVGKAACTETRKAYNEINRENHVFLNNNYRIAQNFIYKGPVLEHYIRIKLKLEDNYMTFDRIVPKSGIIYDLGCGYGTMAMMLKMRSRDRVITGVDYDKDKIDTANNTQLNSDLGICFVPGDALSFQPKKADCIVLSDMLHYFLPSEQQQLLNNCRASLNSGGKLIIRDGDASCEKRHKGTRLSEFFSTRLIGFNKTRNQLNFFSRSFMQQFADSNNFTMEVLDESKRTSNLIYILSKD